MQDADESKPETGRTAENRRKRPPVTIDLEAEAVSEVAAAAPPAAETGDPEVMVAAEPAPSQASESTEPAAAADADPETAAPSEAIERRRASAARFLPVIAAAVLGGVVGGLVTAFLMAPQTDTVGQASIDSRFQTLDGRLGRLEAAVKELPAAAAPAPQDDGRLAAIEAEVAALKSAAASAPPASSGAAPAVDLGPVEARLAALENRPLPAEQPPVDLAPLQAKLGGLQARLDQLEAHPPTDPKTEAAALRIALTSLRQAAAGGGSFADELQAYVALGGDAGPLATLSASGAPSLAALRADFPAIAEKIRAASATADPNASMWDRLAASAGALVEVKPAGPIEGASPTAVLSRMEAAVAAGDLATALREADGLDAAARAPLQDWASGASRRIAIDAALRQLPPAAGSNG